MPRRERAGPLGDLIATPYPLGYRGRVTNELQVLRSWPLRRWVVAAVGGALTVATIAVPTAMIATPVFGRAVPVTPWAWPALLVAGGVSGLLLATYVRTQDPDDGTRAGAAGALLTFFAVGCPVCNKVVLVVLGTAGALQWFAPVQPVLAGAAIVLLLWALRTRLRGQAACRVPESTTSGSSLRQS